MDSVDCRASQTSSVKDWGRNGADLAKDADGIGPTSYAGRRGASGSVAKLRFETNLLHPLGFRSLH